MQHFHLIQSDVLELVGSASACFSQFNLNRRAKVRGVYVNYVPLLESRHLNVVTPTIDDLGPSLPRSWQQTMCSIGSRHCHPSPEWLERFWTLMASSLRPVPESLHSFALVPVTEDQLASVQHCIQRQALGIAHLQGMPSFAAGTLSSIGCVCIEEPRAASVSPIEGEAYALMTALSATSDYLGVPLPELISQQRLGSTDFQNARQLLAYHVQSSTEAWRTIKQWPIFEDITGPGKMVALRAVNSYALLSGASWEEHIVELDQLLPHSPILYHTASATQQKLVQHSSMRVPSLTTFLQSQLLPATTSSSTEPLLLQALDELAREPTRPLISSLKCIFIDGCLHPISKTVDSTSSLLHTLFSKTVDSTSSLLQTQFSKPSTDGDYKLLPQLYATPTRLAVLKQHGLAHVSAPDPNFFIRCSERFSGMSSNLTRDDKRKLSRGLADMLHGNVDAFQRASRSNTAQIASCPVFKSAELQFPYNSTQPEFVALAGSADHDHYQLVSLALPIIDNPHGDTQALRCKLGLPVQPKLQHVVDHLLTMAANSDLKTLLKQGSPLREFVLAGIQRGYQFIISSVSKVQAEAGYWDTREMGDASGRLKSGAWVLVQNCKFVRPCELCFDLEEDTSQGRLSDIAVVMLAVL